MKIYSALYTDYAHLQSLENDIGEAVHCETILSPASMTEYGILILHGGEDISPSLYGQTSGSYTYAKNTPSKRDRIEEMLARYAMENGYPILGICRGAQLLTALAGGTLVQDVTGHGGNHLVVTNDGRVIDVTSAHHQMCNPTGTEHELLAWSKVRRSDHYMGENDQPVQMDLEPEVIYYPKINALAIQPHPEWMSQSSEFVQYMLELVKEKLL